jgi:hypothetical protein
MLPLQHRLDAAPLHDVKRMHLDVSVMNYCWISIGTRQLMSTLRG